MEVHVKLNEHEIMQACIEYLDKRGYVLKTFSLRGNHVTGDVERKK
ncbi:MULTISPECIES: hypothetical protein [Bacillus]|uniref:Uncharacterized protein n=1 Tax=Bacillus sonorensis TaxID=119858 RepID=A0ABM6LEG7_9BACI|nr:MULTISPECIES: hypothetical protein [Bacillus]ASB87666.1 hypothetical protein S101395_01130 [Bacillus sonorensis]MDR4959653.1 hypothetical protein [Bacillus sonorensis]WKB78755.1 hypothetical protein QYM22_07950 [Bacillus glycinifermentans]WPP37659.1 hypothetical protein SK061_05400 [Bacillus sonorensis]SCA85302.1 hypothetical protein BGLY_1479 [Bacillus glycinifermentans]